MSISYGSGAMGLARVDAFLDVTRIFGNIKPKIE